MNIAKEFTKWALTLFHYARLLCLSKNSSPIPSPLKWCPLVTRRNVRARTMCQVPLIDFFPSGRRSDHKSALNEGKFQWQVQGQLEKLLSHGYSQKRNQIQTKLQHLAVGLQRQVLTLLNFKIQGQSKWAKLEHTFIMIWLCSTSQLLHSSI